MFKDAFGVLLKAQCVRFSNVVAKKSIFNSSIADGLLLLHYHSVHVVISASAVTKMNGNHEIGKINQTLG